MVGEGVVVLGEGFLEGGDVFGEGCFFEAVGFGEEDGVGASEVGEPEDEVEVDFLGGDHAVDEDEGVGELRAVGEVVGDELGEVVAVVF